MRCETEFGIFLKPDAGCFHHKALKKWFEGVSVMSDSLRSPEVP